MTDVRFDNRVVLITGAGNGLGKSYALEMAKRGAKVVVNDLGGSAFGDGSDKSAADVVVEEIKSEGGNAVANYDSVVDGDKIVQCALDTFGQIDVVINNAGILRDKTFHKMTREDWDLIYDVHVKGAYAVTHAAWPHLRDQNYGRLIFTASAAGIYGNFGQTNYSMAKLALHGMSQTLALEGRGKNIFVNTIAPIAGSRLTETVMPKELVEALKPKFVMPLVLKLCDENSGETGGLYEVGAGWIGKVRWERTKGHAFSVSEGFSPEDVNQVWEQVIDFENSDHPASISDANKPLIKNLKS
jgi:3-hydroxyacyl-CoA dehydrogenase/3a,7a,12a-trihydroxy-5b-cholest-24-enoyl-CoA hydratase